ncbi:hypothetical protein ACF0H5_001306 [Mactra antiquata]
MPPKKKGGPETKQPDKKRETRVHSTPVVTKLTTQYWDIFCLPVLGCGLLIIGVVLVVLGIVNNLADLILLGCILGAGCVIFFVLLYTTVCRPKLQRNSVNSFDLDKGRSKTNGSEMSALTDYAYYNVSYDHVDDVVIQNKEKAILTESVLYGEKMRTNLGTPATTKDVTFNYDDGDSTPPPPRIALPSRLSSGQTNATYSMDFDKMMETKNKNEISSIELL